MHIVLPGALPDTDAARALAPHVQKTAPALVGWLSNARVKLQAIKPAVTGCTAYEQWQLERAGYQPDPNQNLAAGLGPLWVKNKNLAPAQSIWLAELVHLAPTQSSTAMLTSHDLNITQEQSVALFESAQALFDDTGFSLYPDTDCRWRVEPPADCNFNCASPALVASTSVNDWWVRNEETRPWRRLFNELQMLWFDHPVNHARQAQGLPPVNGLWLFGGGRPEQLLLSAPTSEVQLYEALQAPFAAQDWGAWLSALADLETQVFQPLSQQRIQPTLVLTGRTDIATLEPRALGRWTQWLPRNRNSWSKWWSHRN